MCMCEKRKPGHAFLEDCQEEEPVLKLPLPQYCWNGDALANWPEPRPLPRTIHDVKYNREGRDVLHQRDGSDFRVKASQSSRFDKNYSNDLSMSGTS